MIYLFFLNVDLIFVFIFRVTTSIVMMITAIPRQNWQQEHQYYWITLCRIHWRVLFSKSKLEVGEDTPLLAKTLDQPAPPATNVNPREH